MITGSASAGPVISDAPSLSVDQGVPSGPVNMAVGTPSLTIVSFGAGGSAGIRLPDIALFDRLFDNLVGSGSPSPDTVPSDEAGDGSARPDDVVALGPAAPPASPALPSASPAPLDVPEPAALGLLALGIAVVARRRRA